MPRAKSKPPAAERLIDLALAAKCEFFSDPDGDAWVTVARGGHRETLTVDGALFKGWLTNLFRNEFKFSPNSDALNTAKNQFTAWAQKGAVYEPPLRVAEHAGAIYVDLGDATFRAVKIDATGWIIVADAPVRFRRSPSMLALPEPERGGRIEELRPFLNVKSDHAFVLRVAFMLNSFNASGTHAIIMLVGAGGSSKTGDAARMRLLVDNYSIRPQRLPRDARDIYVGAVHQAVPVFDNLSRLSTEQSDTLCQILTGGGYLERKMHTNKDIAAIKAKRPLIATAVKNPIVHPDLADRTILDNLDAIPKSRRRTEQDLDAAFALAAPRILGALLDGVAEALRRRSTITPGELPRLADLAHFAIAAETCFWAEGTFMQAFAGSRVETVTETVQADEAAEALMTLMADKAVPHEPHLKNLLTDLSNQVGEKTAKAKGWPQTSKDLQNSLKRLKPFLEELGLRFKFDRDRDGAIIRVWDWKRKPPMAEPPNKDEERDPADPLRVRPKPKPDNSLFTDPPPQEAAAEVNEVATTGVDAVKATAEVHEAAAAASAPPPRVCAQCNAGDEPMIPVHDGNTLVFLHKECIRFWQSVKDEATGPGRFH